MNITTKNASIISASSQAAVHYFSATRTVSGYGSAYCPNGTKLTGGGVGTLPNNTYNTYTSHEYVLTGSYPSGTSSWRATATEVDGVYSSSTGWRFTSHSYSPRVYAVCAN